MPLGETAHGMGRVCG